MPTAIRQYLQSIREKHIAGNATEHSYRSALETLVESFGDSINATNEPKRVRCGAPDLIITCKSACVGHIECKDIGVSLNKVEKTEQWKRYIDALENIILTDYLQFRHFVAGKLAGEVTLARLDGQGKIKRIPGAEDRLSDLFSPFLAARSSTIGTPKELAARMAAVAKVIREAIVKALAIEDPSGTLHNELKSFRATILPGMTETEFADTYAQTVCYGLFSACANLPHNKAKHFTREHAAYDLPSTNPFLRDIFDYIAGTHLDMSIVWAVDLLADILRLCDMGEILKDFGKRTKREDPVVHFYETFLAAYDPKLRETRGVYYTPEPVVSYIVRSIDHILKTDFSCRAGLADDTKVTVQVTDSHVDGGQVNKQVHRVQILDPAAGTGTFLYQTVCHIYDAMKHNRGLWPGADGYVARHLLPRLFGFELMMAPYAVAHMKLGWLLKETGYSFPKDDRLRVYLTNTLEEAEIVVGPIMALANQIAREANAASKVKTDCPIMVVMGNPPYSGLSANMNQWSNDLLKKKLPLTGGAPSYYEVDGNPLGEKKVWLQDDYVKFIRFAQYRIERTGYGVLGFITNHAYLDNPTFRGMRQSLMHTFDDIYLVDLHGNQRKKEVAPDGSKDGNVFDILQGVAIGIFVKRENGRKKKPAKVRHAEVWGTRETKYDWLMDREVQSTKWKTLKPNTPFYFFVPRDESLRSEYEPYRQITTIFPENVTGIVTARDAFVIDFGDKSLLKRMAALRDRDRSDADLRAVYFAGKGSSKYPPGDSRGWKLPEARKALQRDRKWRQRCVDILYRPFDIRRIYYVPWMVDWPRTEVMRHILAGENLGMQVCRQTISSAWEHTILSTNLVDDSCVSNKTRERGYFFPLYLYPDPSKPIKEDMEQIQTWPEGKGGRRPNLDHYFVEAFAAKLKLTFISDGSGDRKKTFGPEDVFHYIYAVFHSPTYRTRYAEFLKIDFPRVPLTKDRKLFARLCELGGELVGLHLLEKVPPPAATYPIAGNNVVDKPRYKPPSDEAPGRVYVNKTQYFDGVSPEVWDFHVGGYQVCHKWLKDRKARSLTYEDIETYRKITEALRGTIRLMSAVDEAIPSWPLH